MQKTIHRLVATVILIGGSLAQSKHPSIDTQTAESTTSNEALLAKGAEPLGAMDLAGCSFTFDFAASEKDAHELQFKLIGKQGIASMGDCLRKALSSRRPIFGELPGAGEEHTCHLSVTVGTTGKLHGPHGLQFQMRLSCPSKSYESKNYLYPICPIDQYGKLRHDKVAFEARINGAFIESINDEFDEKIILPCNFGTRVHFAPKKSDLDQDKLVLPFRLLETGLEFNGVNASKFDIKRAVDVGDGLRTFDVTVQLFDYVHYASIADTPWSRDTSPGIRFAVAEHISVDPDVPDIEEKLQFLALFKYTPGDPAPTSSDETGQSCEVKEIYLKRFELDDRLGVNRIGDQICAKETPVVLMYAVLFARIVWTSYRLTGLGLLLGAALLNSSCTLMKRSEAAERQAQVRVLIADANRLAGDGRFDEAIELLEAPLEHSPGTGFARDPDFLFRLAWLCDEFAASQVGERRVELLQKATLYYRATIAELPVADSLRVGQVRVNLALVLHQIGDSSGALRELEEIIPVSYTGLLLKGDILLDGGDQIEALGVYEEAHLQQSVLPVLERDERAANRIIKAVRSCIEARQLLAPPHQSEDGSALVAKWSDLLMRIDRFGEERLYDVAARACERIIQDTETFGPQVTEDALCRWVVFRSRQQALSLTSVARLDAERLGEPLSTGISELEMVLQLAELDVDVVNPHDETMKARIELAIDRRGFWLGTDSAWRRYAFSHALQAISRNHTLYNRPAIAALILEKAVEREQSEPEKLGEYLIAPRANAYESKDPLDRRIDWIDIGLDMELDLVLLFYGFSETIDPTPKENAATRTEDDSRREDDFIAGPRLCMLVNPPSRLATFSTDVDKISPGTPADDKIAPSRTPAEIERVHTVLGLVYARLPDGAGWRGLAERHFLLALKTVDTANKERLQPADAELLRVPHHLRWKIGQGLSQGQSLAAFTAAAKGYIDDNDDLPTARAVYRDALAASRRSEKDLLELERLVFPRDRFYLGGSFGLTRVDSSASQLIDDLHEIDPSFDVFADLDASAQGWKAYLGKRFNDYFEAELGYVALGGPESFVVERGMPNPTFPEAVRSVHPRTADGIALSGIWTPLNWHRLTAGARLGAWYWDSELSVELQTSAGIVTVRDSSDGIDLLYGVKLDYQFDARFGLRAEYELYGVDSDYVSFLSFGLTYLL